MIANIKVIVAGFDDYFRHDLYKQLSALEYEPVEVKDFTRFRECMKSSFDAIIVDINLPTESRRKKTQTCSGIEAAKLMHRHNPTAGILLYGSDARCLSEAEKLYKDGFSGVGFVSSDSYVRPASILPAILAGNWVCISSHPHHLPLLEEEVFLRGLPDTLRQIVLFAVEQMEELSTEDNHLLEFYTHSNQVIAEKLFVSLSTVETRLTHIYAHLGLASVDRRLRTVLLDRALSIRNFRQRK